jgi:arsenate reductase (thioredoxin)
MSLWFPCLAISLLVAPLLAQTSQAPVSKPRIVFVCEHGAAKSVIAAAEFTRAAKAKGLEVTVLARGTNPDPEIPASISAGLRADGLDAPATKPVKVSAEDVKGATKVITFGPDLRPLAGGITVADWSATPSPSENYTAARDYIRKQVEMLVKDLKK